VSSPLGRLFWKVFATFASATLLGIVCSVLLVNWTLGPPPEEVPRWITLVPLTFGLVFALIAGVIVALYLSRPLAHLRRALRKAADAHFDVRVSPQLGTRRDEIVDLGREFDRMAQRLQEASERQQRLFHDVSHELRSPLARMQAAIGLLQQDPQHVEQAIERIKREVQRVDSLVDELLTLHRVEAGSDRAKRERVDVMELLAAIVQDADFEARARNGGVRLHGGGSFVAEVDGELVYRAFENVIRNAIKYTAPGSTVDVEANIAGDVLEVKVLDRGSGVPAELCEEIFEPFRRLEGPDASNRRVPGTGLGLPIARRAMKMHGGSVNAAPRDGGGLAVLCRLPRSTG